jgi:hypothetical protein
VSTTTPTRPVTGRSRQQALIRQARERQHRRRRRIAVLALVATIAGAVIVGVIRGGHRPSTAAPPPPAGAGRSRTVERPGRTYLTGQRYRGPAVFAAIEPAHGRLGPIREGAGTAISPNGQLMLDLDGSADRVLVTNLATGRPERHVDVGAGPSAIAFSPDSRTAYIADSGSALSAAGTASSGSSPSTQPSDLVTPIDLRTDRAGPAIKVCAGPRGLAVSAPAHLLIVTCQSTVALVDTRTDRLVRSLGIGGYDRDIVAVSPDGDTAVVGDTQLGDGPIPSGTIVPIDLITETAGPPIPISDRAGTGGALNLTFPPGASNRLYVTTGRLGHSGPVYPEVLDVDLVTQTVSAPLWPTHRRPERVVRRPDRISRLGRHRPRFRDLPGRPLTPPSRPHHPPQKHQSVHDRRSTSPVSHRHRQKPAPDHRDQRRHRRHPNHQNPLLHQPNPALSAISTQHRPE